MEHEQHVSAEVAVPRDERGRWLPGAPSPNPAGRYRGAKSRLGQLRDAILEAAELEGGGPPDGVVNTLRELYRAEPTAFAGLLARCLPPLRAVDADERGALRIVELRDFTGGATSAEMKLLEAAHDAPGSAIADECEPVPARDAEGHRSDAGASYPRHGVISDPETRT
jgi:hypothetical protein